MINETARLKMCVVQTFLEFYLLEIRGKAT